MARPSLLERYFAQCQAHRTPPRPEFVASLRDGVMEVNLADIPLADIRLFAYALLDTSRTGGGGGGGGPPSARSRNASFGHQTRRDGASSSTASSQHGPTNAFARTQFVKLHFSYDVHGPGPSPAAPSSLLSPQNEATLRCLLEAVAVAIKENASTLSSFAWCGMPLSTTAAPGRTPYQPMPQHRGGGYARSAVTIVGALPLCHHLRSLRFDGARIARAQFMQLTLLSPANTVAGRSAAAAAASVQGDVAWPALEEVSFAGCGLTDACRNGLAHLLRAAVAGAAGAVWQRSLRSGGGSPADRVPPRFSGGGGGGGGAAHGVKRLDVSGNPLGNETARTLAAAMSGSALRYLNLSNTAVAWEGAVALTAPSVLDDTAMELLDLSNTGVSEMLGAAGGGRAIEAKLLAESTVATGFRVVARGMGQLLVLRESARSPQQPWRMQTGAAGQLRVGDAVLPAVDTTQAPARSISPAPSTQVSVAAPFAPHGPVPAVAASSFPAPPPPSSPTPAYPSASSASAAPAPAAAGPYGPWWALFAQWCAAQGVPPAPGSGPGYVPVPVPFPVLAPMLAPMPYGAPAPPPPPAAATATSTAAPPPHATPPATCAKGEAAAVPDPAPAREGADATCVLPASPPPPPRSHTDGEAGEAGSANEFVRHPLDAASVTATTDDDVAAGTATDSDGALVQNVSAAAGDRQFLLALISRLEAYELGVTERLEAQHQRTTTQLTALEKDVRFRLQQLADAERRERATAAERQTALLEAVSRLREASAADTDAADMTEAMLPQLIRLIEVGMERVQAALGEPDSGRPATSPRHPRPQLETVPSRGAAASSSGDRDLVAAASKRLKQLGW